MLDTVGRSVQLAAACCTLAQMSLFNITVELIIEKKEILAYKTIKSYLDN